MNTNDVLQVAEGISNFGVLILIAAVFLLLAGSLMVACFRWFRAIVNNMIERNDTNMSELLSETRQQNVTLAELTEALRPETLLQIKNTTSVYFDLAVERVYRIIKRIREENHIADKEATKNKIHDLLANLHGDRNSRWDSITYRGRKLSSYANPEWIAWVEGVVTSEVYTEHPNNGRAHTNVQIVYDRIKQDMNQRLMR